MITLTERLADAEAEHAEKAIEVVGKERIQKMFETLHGVGK